MHYLTSKHPLHDGTEIGIQIALSPDESVLYK